MGHPFSDAPKFPWWREPEAHNLLRALVDVTPTGGALARVSLFYQRCKESLPHLTETKNAERLWLEALNNLGVGGGALRTLCQILSADRDLQKNVVLQRGVQAVYDAQPARTTRLVAATVAIPDRDKLRVLLERFDNAEDPLKVVLVRGDRKRGKSHRRYLFERAPPLPVGPGRRGWSCPPPS